LQIDPFFKGRFRNAPFFKGRFLFSVENVPGLVQWTFFSRGPSFTEVNNHRHHGDVRHDCHSYGDGRDADKHIVLAIAFEQKQDAGTG
jgi:hypothetical protein